MQIVIELPKEKDFIDRALWEDVSDFDAEDLAFILYAIAHGTVLPDNHGRLIDADAFERRCMFDSDIEDMQDVIYALRDYKSIIEADKAERSDKE